MSLIGSTQFQKSDGTPNGVPVVVGHRGFRGRFPENTMLAIREGVRAGAKVIETDIQLAKDGVVVMCHDVDTGRCFNAKRVVEESNYVGDLDQLYTKDKYEQPMPTLHEVATAFVKDPLFKDVTLMIDIKRSNGPHVASHMVKVLESVAPLSTWKERCILGVWRKDVLKAVNTVVPSLDVCFIGWEQRLAKAFMQNPQVRAISCNYSTFAVRGGTELLGEARAKNLKIYTWTVNAPEPMKWSVAARVDGVITDYPDLLSRFFETISEQDLYGQYFTSEPNKYYSFAWMVQLYLMYFMATAYLVIADSFGFKKY